MKLLIIICVVVIIAGCGINEALQPAYKNVTFFYNAVLGDINYSPADIYVSDISVPNLFYFVETILPEKFCTIEAEVQRTFLVKYSTHKNGNITYHSVSVNAEEDFVFVCGEYE